MADTLLSFLRNVPLKFNRDVLDGGGDAGLQLHTQHPEFIQALHTNKVPKPDQPIVIAEADISLENGRNLSFGSGNTGVGFSSNAGAKLGIFSLPSQLRDGIVEGGDLAESVEAALNFDNGSLEPFLLLRLGYDVNGTAAGSMALGPGGALSFSANAGRQGLYAIVSQPAPEAGLLESLQRLVGSVRLPKQVRSADDLPPATWMIAEADGSIGLRADVQFGYDLSWIRETKAGILTGDIGLKLAMGISAGLGFNAAGKYAILLSRHSPDPAEKTLRLRIYKLSMREMNFAFRAQALVTPVAGILPDQLDDLLKGVLGTHPNQVMRLLGKVDDWTDPSKPIFGPFANVGAAEATKILQSVTGMQDLQLEFQQAKALIRRLYETWDGLPAAAAARIMAAAKDDEALDRIAAVTGQIKDAKPDDLRAVIEERLNDVGFLQSLEGQIAEQLAINGLFATLNNAGLLDQLQQTAAAAFRLVDAVDLRSPLVALHREVETRLKLRQMEDAMANADLSRLDAWLLGRLETFLEEKLAGKEGIRKLQELRENIRKIRTAMPDLYKKALAALQRDYSFSLNATYRNTSKAEALVDIEFDFAADDSAAPELLRVALEGRFDDVLRGQHKGVTVREAALTHGMKRETNVALALPFFSRKTTHINEVLASMTTVAQSGGRLFFQLKAQDLVSVKNEFAASLTISMQLLSQHRTGAVAIHSEDTATYLQTLDRAFVDESLDDLARYAAPFVEPLFRDSFGTFHFREWANESFGQNGAIGKALLSLDVTLPPSACLAWLKAPSDKKAPVYQQLSLRLQAKMKRLISDAFFQRIERYDNVSTGSDAFAVLVYSSIPACIAVNLSGSSLTLITSNTKGDVYWNQSDAKLRSAMASAALVKGTLTKALTMARARLQTAGDPKGRIPFYKESQAAVIVANAAANPVFRSLLFVEALMVQKVVDAALEMAKFRDNSLEDPPKARKALAQFGADVTNAFNEKLKNVAVGDALLPLGSLMFVEAAQTLDPSLQSEASAMLAITDVKDTIPFPPFGFPNHDPLPEGDIIHAETLVHTR